MYINICHDYYVDTVLNRHHCDDVIDYSNSPNR